MRFTTKLLPSRSGNLGVVTLNNPKALHSLTQDMIDCFQDVLDQWTKSSDDTDIKGILIKASQDGLKRPIFCAGGDVKAVYENGLATGNKNPENFFFTEYHVNHAIATSKIPIISLWDGIVMGGGCGISIHGKYRIATENTILAMPETAIGLFPDVGSCWWMNKLLKRPIANYLALTGTRISSADLMYTGLATHYVPSKVLPDLESALVEASEQTTTTSTEDAFAGILMSFHESIPTDDCLLAQNSVIINQTFQADHVEDIIAKLEKAQQAGDADSEFATQTLETLSKMSPTSLKITLEGLNRGSKLNSIEDDLQMEYRMARKCAMKPHSDFFEGVRALLVDKDQNPKWNPTRLEDVTPEIIEEYFEPIEKELLLRDSINSVGSSSSSSRL